MNSVLLIIFFFLIIYVGGKKGIKSFISLVLNFLVLIGIFYFSALGINSIIISLAGCLIISYITLFFVNDINIKTISSFISILIVLLLLISFVYIFTNISQISGFSEEAFEKINMFSYDININMTNISISVIILGLMGATIDTSIAISSALYEVYINNKKLSKKQLFKSGITIGKDILCTTTNTLLFAYLSEFMTLIIWFISLKYTVFDIMNAKVFVSEFIKILSSSLGCVLVIPITAIITAILIKKLQKMYN